jgi:arylsulfatase A-like enzyme
MLSLSVVAGALLATCLLLHQEPYRATRRSPASIPPGKPNIMLVTLDTVRADHMSLYGYERDTTPNLSKLAEEASVYTRAIAPGDMTLSSHASIFTGLYPSWHKTHFDPAHPAGRPLDGKYPVLPEILSAKGFDSIGIAANYLFLGAGFGLDRGYSYYDVSAATPFLGATRSFFLRQRIRNILIRFSEPWRYDPVFRRAGEINDAALTLLRREKAEARNFFLFLNYMDAHSPYLPPGQFATRYPGVDRGIPSGHYDGILKDVVTRKHHLSDRERRHFMSQYDAGIAYMDASIGTLIDGLKQEGLYENTLLIITADHGEAFGERDLMGHALSVYQDEVHVPLIVHYPKQQNHVAVDTPVSLVDLLPTIMEVLGYNTPKDVQGRSLLKRSSDGDPVFSETFAHPLMSAWSPRFQRNAQCIISGSMKFIHSSNGARELYDLASDPNEEHNLAVESASAPLEARLGDFFKAAGAPDRRATPARVNTQTVERLKSLGYIQ